MNPSKDGKSVLTLSQARKQISLYLANFVENTVDAIVAFDFGGEIVYWNPAAEQMYGWKAEEVLGNASIDHPWHKSNAHSRDELEQMRVRLKKGETVRGERRVYPKEGLPFWVEYTIRAILDKNNEILGYVSVYRDIDTHKQAEESLNLSRNHVEETIRRLNRLQTVTAALSESLTPEQVAKVIVDQGAPAMDAVNAVMILLAEDGQTSELVYTINPDAPVNLYPEFNLSLDIPVVDTIRSGQPLWFETQQQIVERYPHISEHTNAWNHHALVAVPLVVKGRISGAFSLIFDRPVPNTPENLDFVLTLARQGSLALERARLYRAEQQARWSAERLADQMSRLEKVSARLSESLTPEQVAKVVVDQGAPALEAVNGSLILLGKDGESIEFLYTFLKENVIHLYPDLSLSVQLPILDAIRSGQAVWIETQEQYKKQYPHLAKYITGWGHEATLAVPLVVKGRTIGAFSLSFDRPLENIPENQGFILTLSQQAAQALERAQLYQDEQKARQAAERAADRTDRLQQITATLTKLATPEQLATAVIQQAVLVTEANAGFLVELLENSQELRMVTAIGYPFESARIRPISISAHTPLSDCIRTGQAVWIRSREELAARYPSLPENAQNPGHQAIAAIPLRIGYRVLGGLVFDFLEKRDFEKEEQDFFLTVGQQCAQGFDRARSIAALRQSEERFRSMANSAPVMIWISGTDKLTTWFNKSWLDFVGREMEQELGIGWTENVHPDDLKLYLQTYSTAFDARQAFTMEYRLKRRDGEYRWLLESGTPTFGPNNDFTGYIGSCVDITERKRAEEALRESEERYRYLVKHAPSGIYEIDIKSMRFVEVNDIMSDILGYTHEELLSMLPEELLDEESRGRFKKRILQTLAGEKIPEQTEYRIKAKDGRELWTVLNTTINYENGQARSVSVIAHDITERKQAEKTLAQQSELLQGVFDHIPVLLVMWNPSLKQFTLNRHAEKVLGWTTADANEGDFMSKVYPNPEYRKDVSAFMQSLEGGFRELLTTAKDGEQIPIDWANIRLADATMIGIGVDLRERKRAEEALKARSEEIEAILQLSPIAIFVAYDPECKRITANPAGYKLVEVPPEAGSNISKSSPGGEQLPYRVFRDGVELSSEELPMQVAARLGVEVLEDSLELRFKHGPSKYIYSYAKPLVGENGKPRGAISAMLDITELKQVEDQLERSNQRLNEILASIQDDFYVLDRGWKFIFASRSFTSKIGKEPEDFIGNNIWEMFPKHVGTIFEENLRTAMEKREVQRFEIGGKYTNAWYRMTAFPSAEGITVLGTDVTVQKQTEEQLRYQAALLSNVSDAIVASDAEYRITAWNSGAEALYGWKAEEVMGRNGLEFVRTEWAEKDADEMRLAIAETGRWRGEATQVRRDGTRFPVDVSSMVLYGDQGQITGYVSVNRDITERKKAEMELRESENKFSILFEKASFAVALSRLPDGILMDVNEAWENAFGFTKQEAIGKTTLELNINPNTEERAHILAQLQESGSARNIELTLRTKGGDWCYFLTNVDVIEIGGQKFMLNMVQDITEQKKVENALRESEERFRRLANTVPAIVWTAAPDGTILFTNEFWHTYTGSSPEQPGHNWAELLHPDDAERGAAAWNDATENIMDYFLESRIRRHDGQYRWFQARATPIRDTHGNVTAWYGVSVDIHERIEAVSALRDSQQQLQFLNENLEQKVNEQTAELRNLTSNLTKAEQRERQRLAHVLHEDLQQRLYAVKLQLAFLPDEAKPLEPVVEKELANVNKQLDEILALTRSLTIELSPPILHDEGLTQAINWLAAQMREKHGMQIEVLAKESFAISDEAIQVLLFNCVRELLFNIVKHAGVKQASVSLERIGGTLQIEVRDQGKGFNVAALTEKNGQGNDEDEPRHSSFGLPTLRHQLDLLGGKMDIQSEPYAGTCITLTIPYS